MSAALEAIIEAVAVDTGRTVNEVKAYLRDEAVQDWPMLRAFLQRGLTPPGKTVAREAPNKVDES